MKNNKLWENPYTRITYIHENKESEFTCNNMGKAYEHNDSFQKQDKESTRFMIPFIYKL